MLNHCENSASALTFQIQRNGKCCGGLQGLKSSISFLTLTSAIFVDFKALASTVYIIFLITYIEFLAIKLIVRL